MLVGSQIGNLSYFKKVGNVFVKQQDTTAGIGISISSGKQNISPFLADFNANGTLDLATVTLDGVIAIYEDIRSNLNGSPTATSNILAVAGSASLVKTAFPNRSSLAAGDLNGDGKPEMIVGGRAGGLNYLSSMLSTSIKTGSYAEADKFRLFPNPATSEVSLSSETPGVATVYDLTGRLVIEGHKVLPGVKTTLRIDVLHPGVYFVDFTTDSGERATKKLLVQ